MTNQNINNNSRILVGERVYVCLRGKKKIYVADLHYCGRHIRRSLKTRNMKIARKRALRLERELFEVESPAIATSRPKRKSVVLAQAIDDFVSFNVTEGLRHKTVTKYRGIMQTFLTFASDHQVKDVIGVDMVLFDKYRAFRRPHLSDKSMHHEGALLKRFLWWCADRKWIAENPLADRKFSPPKTKKRPVLTLSQVNAILNAAAAVRHPIIAMLAVTGMRSGECRNLLVEDVDLDAAWIHIRSREGAPTKTGEDWKVPIHPRLKEVLQRMPRRKTGWFFTALPSLKFPEGGHHISTKHLNEDFLRILEKLGIPMGRKNGFTVHSLRHFFKTFCINSRVPKPVVDEWQGHGVGRDPSDSYYHLSDAESQRLMSEVPFGTGEPMADVGEEVSK